VKHLLIQPTAVVVGLCRDAVTPRRH